MNRTITTTLILSATLVLTGCGDSDTDSTPKPEGATPSADAATGAKPSTDLVEHDTATPAPAPEADAASGGATPDAVTPTAPMPAASEPETGSTKPAATGSADVTGEQSNTMALYIDTLDALVGKAEGITSQMDAVASSPKIKELADQLTGYAEQLESYSPETMTALRKMYDENLSTIKARFDTELTRLKENDNYKAVADLLEQIKLP